jgi:cysteinyl-tRNA synthetase
MADLRFQYDSRGKDIKDLLEEVGSSIVYSMQDDINSPSALAALSKLVDEATMPITSENANQFEALLATVDDLLGLDLRASSDITPAQKKNIAKREAARQNNDWKSADQYRQELLLENIIINDTPIGPLWRRT